MAVIPTRSPCAWSHNGTTSVALFTPAPVPASNHSYSFGSDDDGSGEIRTRVIIALTIARVVLASVGCGANVVAAVVLTNRKLWSPTSMLLLSLVIYDAIYLLLVVPVGVVSISVNVQFSLASYTTLHKVMTVCYPLRSMAQMASTYTTLTVTTERFLVILLPLKASSMWTYGKTRRAIVAVLLFSVVFNLPRCFDHVLSKQRVIMARGRGAGFGPAGNVSSWNDTAPGSVYMGLASSPSAWQGAGSDVTSTGNASCPTLRSGPAMVRGKEGSATPGNRTPWVEMGQGESEGVSDQVYYLYKVVYMFYLTVVFLYIIPYLLIPVLNLQLVIALRRRREESRRISAKQEHRFISTGRPVMPARSDKEDGLTYIVFGITLCYIVCCILPASYLIVAIATNVANTHAAILIFNAGETALVINAATDFLFYCLLGRKFRRVFMRTFCRKHYTPKTTSFSMRTTVSYNSV